MSIGDTIAGWLTRVTEEKHSRNVSAETNGLSIFAKLVEWKTTAGMSITTSIMISPTIETTAMVLKSWTTLTPIAWFCEIVASFKPPRASPRVLTRVIRG